MVLTATTVGGYLRDLPTDRRVAMARVCSMIRRAARGVRESMRYGLAFYELDGPLFALESNEDKMTLFVAEESVITNHADSLKGVIKERSAIEFTDLTKIPMGPLEKIVRESVIARRERLKTSKAPTQAELLKLWKIAEEDAQTLPPIVRIPMGRDEVEEEVVEEKEEKKEPTVILRAPTFKDPAMTARSRPKKVPPLAKAEEKPKRTTRKTSAKKAVVTEAEASVAEKPKRTRRTTKKTEE